MGEETNPRLSNGTSPDDDALPGKTSLHLSATDLFLELESSFESRRVRYSRGIRPGETYVNQDLRLSQLLGFRFEGFVFDPDFLEFHGGIALGLSQERFREDAGPSTHTDSDDGFLSEYNLSMTAWRDRPVSVSAYARRLRDRVPRRFLPSLLDERVETGVSLLALTGSWTTEVGVSWSDIDRTGQREEQDDEHIQNRRFYVDSRGELGPHQRLHLSFDHQRDNTEYQGTRQQFDTTRDEFRVEHELEFGPGYRHKLDTFARFNEERGDLARDEFEFSPRLTLRHSDKFQTIYRYSFYEFDQDVVEWTRHKVDVEAVYRPTRDWRITGDLFVLRERIENDLVIDQYGSSLDLTYRRPMDSGVFGMNAAVAFDRAEHEGTGDAGFVRGEIHVLDTVRPAYLLEWDVAPPSIIAYNAARTRIFRPGIDYRMIVLGRRTAVFRVISGWIAEDEPVYFDYEYEIPLHATIDTFRADLNLEYEFTGGWTPYYQLELRREYAENSARLEDRPDETERHRLGLRYDGSRWSGSAEAEVYNDSVLPYDAYHLAARAPLLRAHDHSLDTAVQLSRYLFKADFDSRHVWWFNAELSDRVQLTPECSSKLAAVYRYESDSIDGRTNGLDLQGGVAFRRGFLQVELTAEYDLLSFAESREAGYGVWLNVRRDLSHVLPGWRMDR